MFHQSGSNEIHNLIIRDITDNSWMDNPYVTIKCTGYLLNDIKKISYSCTVRVYGDLMQYVINELRRSDKICVVGHSDMAHVDKYLRRVTVADQIFKSDWLHYFKGGLNA